MRPLWSGLMIIVMSLYLIEVVRFMLQRVTLPPKDLQSAIQKALLAQNLEQQGPTGTKKYLTLLDCARCKKANAGVLQRIPKESIDVTEVAPAVRACLDNDNYDGTLYLLNSFQLPHDQANLAWKALSLYAPRVDFSSAQQIAWWSQSGVASSLCQHSFSSTKAVKWLVESNHLQLCQLQNRANSSLLMQLVSHSKTSTAEWLIRKFNIPFPQVRAIFMKMNTWSVGKISLAMWKMLHRMFPEEITGDLARESLHVMRAIVASPRHIEHCIRTLGLTNDEIVEFCQSEKSMPRVTCSCEQETIPQMDLAREISQENEVLLAMLMNVACGGVFATVGRGLEPLAESELRVAIGSLWRHHGAEAACNYGSCCAREETGASRGSEGVSASDSTPAPLLPVKRKEHGSGGIVGASGGGSGGGLCCNCGLGRNGSVTEEEAFEVWALPGKVIVQFSGICKCESNCKCGDAEESGTGLRGNNELPDWITPRQLRDVAMHLKLVERVFLLARVQRIPQFPRGKETSSEEKLKDFVRRVDWSAAYCLWRKVKTGSANLKVGVPGGFRVSCKISRDKNSTTPRSNSDSLSAELARLISFTSGSNWRASPRNFELEITIRMDLNAIVCGFPLSGEPLSVRPYIPHWGMRPTIAHAMCVLANLSKHEITCGTVSSSSSLVPKQYSATVLDPMCGQGTILVEAAVCWRGIHCTGADISTEQLHKAKLNSEAAHINNSIQLVAADIQTLPQMFRKDFGGFDVILCDAPFGQKHTPLNGTTLSTLYSQIIHTTKSLLKQSGIAVFLAPRNQLIPESICEHSEELTLVSTHNVRLGATEAALFVLVKS
ncbi:hypothetical protein Pelo_3334 [Pelomyxa schiedti]|nr:hypothetical protein Pelo_3334 [Pelomyxa schiedti]